MTDEEAKANFLGVLPEARSEVLYDLLMIQNKRLDEVYKAIPELANQVSQALQSLGQQTGAALNDLASKVKALEDKDNTDEKKGILILPNG